MTIWGAAHYIPAGKATSYLNDTVFQLAKDCGITHLLMWQRNYNESNALVVTTAQMVAAVKRMKDFGLQPIIDLYYTVAEATALVQALGSDCKIYEVCKEPHISSGCQCVSAADYASKWNAVVNACRPLAAPGTMFGGPAVGIASSSQSWMQTWLNSCRGDFASYHLFPEGGTKAGCIANAVSVTTQTVNMYRNMLAAAGKSLLPLLITEAQYTSGVQSGTGDFSTDAAFMTSWTKAFFDTCKGLNVYAVMLWVFMGYDNNFCMVRPNYAIKPQYTVVKNYIGGAPPVPQHVLAVNSTPSGIPFTYTKI